MQAAIKSSPLILWAFVLFSLTATACGRRHAFDLSGPGAAGAALRQGQIQCAKSNCPKMELLMDVTVAGQGQYSAANKSILLPGNASTQIRFSAKLADSSVTRHAALLIKESAPWLTTAAVELGSLTLAANPPAGANAQVKFQVRDITYCKANSKAPDDCAKSTATSDSDKFFVFTIATGTGLGQGNGSYVLPSQSRCVTPPSGMEQSVGSLQGLFTIGAAVLTGNFLPIITNIGGSLISGGQNNGQPNPQGC